MEVLEIERNHPKWISMVRRLPSPKKLLKISLFILILVFFFVRLASIFSIPGLLGTTMNGDELKYMRMLHSLATDGNVELSNLQGFENHRSENRKALPEGEREAISDLYFIGKDGGIYCLHLPGIALLMLPLYKLDSVFYPNHPDRAPLSLPYLPSKLYFLRLWLAILCFLTLLLLYRLLSYLFKSLILSAFLIFLIILNSSVLIYAFRIFPEIWAMFFSLLSLNTIIYPFKRRKLNDALFILSVACLPWLHQRFIFLSLGLFVAYIYFKKIPVKKILGFSLIFALLSLPYFYFFYSITGDPSPLSPSRLHGRVYARLDVLPIGFFANFFHPKQGVLWFYPWLILFFFGIYLGFKKRLKLTLALMIVYVPYYLISSMAVPWWGGNIGMPPGRFIVVMYPFFVIFSAIILQDLYRQFSFRKLFFYFGFLALLILNSRIWFLYLDFGQYINPETLELVFKSLLLTLIIFFSYFLGEKYVFPRRAEV